MRMKNLLYAMVGAAIVASALWANLRAQDNGLFKVGTCWRLSDGAERFAVLAVNGPWVKTHDQDLQYGNGSTWMNTNQMTLVKGVTATDCAKLVALGKGQ
jgi:hypothetical protein